MKNITLLFSLLVFSTFYAQDLDKKYADFTNLTLQNPQKGKMLMQQLSKEALAKNNRHVYLQTLHSINWCHTQFGDYKEVLASSKFSLQQAEKYKDDFFCAKSLEYIARAYLSLGIDSEFHTSIAKAFEYSENVKKGDSLYKLKSSLFAVQGEFYNQKEDDKNFLLSYKKAIQEDEKIKSVFDKNNNKIYNFANVALAFKYLEKYDSMYHYSQKVIALHPEKYNSYYPLSQAYGFIGEKYYLDKNYDLAIENLNKSLQIANNIKNDNLRLDNYNLLSKAYLAKKDEKAFFKYTQLYTKLSDSINIVARSNTQKVANKIIEEKTDFFNQEKKNYYLYIFLGVLSLFLALFLLLRNFRKAKKIEVMHQQTSDLLVKEKENVIHLQSKVNESFDELIALAKKNSPNFYPRFAEVYPDLMHHLSSQFPELSILEKNFLGMVYLNFSTKELADILSVTVKTVETRKYRIRKKCNIETSQNLQNWLENFA